MENTSEVMDLTKVALTIPPCPEIHISRDNLLFTLDEMLLHDADVLFVDGPEGIGKSTLLSDFARRHPETALSLFVSGSSRFGYNPSGIFSDLHDQISWILKKEHFRDNQEDAARLLYSKLNLLHKKANHERITFYFIIDGLHEIPPEGRADLEIILDSLPFGVNRFKFLISGQPSMFGERFKKVRNVASFRVVGYSFEDTKKYLDPLVRDIMQIQSIYDLSGKNPGNLASLRRQLSKGITYSELVNDLSKNTPNWLQMEWNSIDKENSPLKEILSHLVFFPSRLDPTRITTLLKIRKEDIETLLSQCTFVRLLKDGSIDFVCDAMRKIASEKLSRYKKQTLENIIKSYFSGAIDDEALANLPTILHQAGQHEDLLNFLSLENLNLIVKSSDSWIPLHQKMEMAIKSTLKLKKDDQLVRFGIQRAALTTLQEADPWRAEIDAYVNINDLTTISAIAQQLPAKEDRLQLLAVIAKSRKMQGLSPDTEINQQIGIIYGQIDHTSLGRRGISIASDLLYTHPELAVELIQAVTENGTEKTSADLAFARLSIDSLLKDQGAMNSAQQDLRARIKDPNIKKYTDTAAVFFGSYSAQAVIAEVGSWEKPGDKIVALKGWTSRNAASSEAKIVMEFTFDLILRSSTYTANANTYYHLCKPLPNIKDIEYVRRVIVKIDTLRAAIEVAGPTSEFIRLQCVLAHAEYKFNRKLSYSRCSVVFHAIERMQDYATRLECFSILTSALKLIDPDQNFSAEGPILELSIDGINSTAEIILTKTASHYEAVRGALGVLATTQPGLAFGIVAKLNTVKRRDRALAHICNEISSLPNPMVQWEAMEVARKDISCPLTKALSIRTILRNIFNNRENIHDVNLIIPFKQHIESVPNVVDRAKLFSILLDILYRGNIKETLATEIEQRIHSEWQNIHSSWDKISTGFFIVSTLAKSRPDFCRNLLDQVEESRSAVVLDSEDAAKCYIGGLKLTLRAFFGLLKNKTATDQDFFGIKQLIDRVPCEINQVSAWAELAMRAEQAGDSKMCKQIVTQTIEPMLDRMASAEEATHSAVVMAATALHCCHPPSVKARLKEIPPLFRDSAVSEICDFIIEGKLPFEEYDDRSRTKDTVKYSQIIDVCDVLAIADSDYTLSWTLQKMLDCISDKRFKTQFTRVQQIDIDDRIRNLINSKLPNISYIQHEGYKIVCEASLNRLTTRQPWDDLAARARNIPNLADSAFVIMTIAGQLPKKEKAQAVILLNEARSMIPSIPFFEDRLHHFENLARISQDIDKEISKMSLRAAWTEGEPLDGRGMSESKRRIIDFAHRLDPEFASALASEVAGDPGREFARAQVRDQLNLIKLKDSLSSGKEAETSKLQLDECVTLSNMMMKGLNSGRLTTLHADKLRPYLGIASNSGIKDTYSIFAWAIENAVRRYVDDRSNVNHIRPLFEATKLAAELTFRIASKIRSAIDQDIYAARRTDDVDVLIRPGERQHALDRIFDWAKTATGYIKITDPYFCPEDLDIIKLIREVNPSIPIHILTGRAKHSEVMQPWEDTYQSYWRMSVADFDPGLVTITVVGWQTTSAHPIHDRWCLSQSSGLRLGTSISSIGINRSSEISDIDPSELVERALEFDSYASSSVTSPTGDRLRRTSFDLH